MNCPSDPKHNNASLISRMILSDPKWEGLEGGYRIPYDPRPVLSKLASGIEVDHAWDELWNELHHQGDVGEASFAQLPL